MRDREPAQVIVLFAIALIAMLAMVGVAVDGGTLYLQRRTAQNAADAAALGGARALQQATSSPTASIPSEICKYVLANNFGVTPNVAAYFVDTNGNKVTGGDIALPAHCSGSVSSTSIWSGVAGVHVDVTMGPYNTYLVGIVGIRQLSATAGATAQVWNYAINAAYIAPWAVCGPSAPIDTSGTLQDILDTTNNTILQSAIDAHVNVILQSAQMNAGASSWTAPPPACPDTTHGSDWKGKVDPGSGIIILPDNMQTVGGNGAITPPCAATGQSDPSGPGECFLFVPVTDAHNTPDQAHVVTFACMSVYPGTNSYGLDKWWGTLEPVSACPTYPYKPLWTFGSGSSNTLVALTS